MLHWILIITNSVRIGTRLQLVDFFYSKNAKIVETNAKKFCYNEHPLIMNIFLCFILNGAPVENRTGFYG